MQITHQSLSGNPIKSIYAISIQLTYHYARNLMTRKISNLVLAVVSALILLFIAIAFYDAFTREPVNRSVEVTPSSSGSVSGVITAPTADSSATSSTAPSTTVETDPSATTSSETTPQNSTGDTRQNATTNAYESTSDAGAHISTENSPPAEVPNNTNSVGDDSHILRDKPELRDALPPIPSAPPSPVATPPVSSPQEAYSTTEPPQNPGLFPAPIPDNSFPSPVSPSPATPTQPADPFIPPSHDSNSNFPAPISLNSTTESVATQTTLANTALSSPAAVVTVVAPTAQRKQTARRVAKNKTLNNTETQQLRQLRSEKEQLRRSLGLP